MAPLRMLKYYTEGLLHYISYKLLMIYGIIYFITVLFYLLYRDNTVLKVSSIVLWLISTPLIIEFTKGVASIFSRGAIFTKFSESRRKIISEKYRTRALLAMLFVVAVIIMWTLTLVALAII